MADDDTQAMTTTERAYRVEWGGITSWWKGETRSKARMRAARQAAEVFTNTTVGDFLRSAVVRRDPDFDDAPTTGDGCVPMGWRP